MFDFNQHLQHDGLTDPYEQFLEAIMRSAFKPVKCIDYISIYAPCAFYADRAFLFREVQHLFTQPPILWICIGGGMPVQVDSEFWNLHWKGMQPIVQLGIRNLSESRRHREQQVCLADNSACGEVVLAAQPNGTLCSSALQFDINDRRTHAAR